jgi:hypothetical protein
MAFEEKRRLSQGLGSLAGDKLGVVMEIIAETQPFGSVRRLSIQCSKQDISYMTCMQKRAHASWAWPCRFSPRRS